MTPEQIVREVLNMQLTEWHPEGYKVFLSEKITSALRDAGMLLNADSKCFCGKVLSDHCCPGTHLKYATIRPVKL